MLEQYPFQKWHEEAKKDPKKVYLEVALKLEEMVRQKAEAMGWPKHDHSFARSLDFLKQRRALYRDEVVRLGHFWDIRNSLVHNTGLSVELSLVEDLIAYAHNILRKNAETAEHFMTPFVVTVPDTATLPQAIKILSERSFSQLPILHENKITGLLTHHEVINLLGQNKNWASEPITLAECLKKLDTQKKNFEIVGFKMEVPDILDLYQKNPFLQAVIVTEHGRADEPPQGIIAPVDFLSLI